MRAGRPDRARPCPAYAEQRSALVDGALDLVRQERLLAHLVTCPPCRGDVAELRRLRERLRTPAPGTAPSGLTQRLVGIAGAEAADPLWSRPFRRTRRGRIDSRRRVRRLRRAAAAVAAGASVASAAVVGYAAAPPDTLRAVRDPAPDALAEFGAVLTQSPLTHDAVAAVLSADPASLAAPSLVAVAATTPGTRLLPAGSGRTTLGRAATAAEEVGYRGMQTLRTRVGGQTYTATLRVVSVVGEGTRSELLDPTGHPVSVGYGPAVTSATRLGDGTASAMRLGDGTPLSLLERHYHLLAWSGAKAAGRPATLVEARRGARVAARWWVDDASGVVLAQESLDQQNRPVVQVGFTSLELSGSGVVSTHRPTRTAAATTDTVLTLAMAPDLSSRGWVCREHVAGLPLVRLRSDSADDPAAVHLVYSDGVATVSVVEERGRLATPPRGSSWDPALRAHVLEGTARIASWQTGGTVLTVVTDGSAELLAAAVASLPHEALPERTTMDRVSAGWARILADVKG